MSPFVMTAMPLPGISTFEMRLSSSGVNTDSNYAILRCVNIRVHISQHVIALITLAGEKPLGVQRNNSETRYSHSGHLGAAGRRVMRPESTNRPRKAGDSCRGRRCLAAGGATRRLGR